MADQDIVQVPLPTLGNISTITKLTKTNYKDWSEEIEIELKLRGVYKAVVEPHVDEMVDLQARRIILETMDKEHRAQVRGYSSAKAIMDRLKISYAEATDARKYRTLVKFFRFVKSPTDDIDTHIGKVEGMRADLKDLDFEIDEEILIATIIGSLPSEYGNIMETWELAAPEQKTKQNLIAKLLNREADLKASPSVNEHALAVLKKEKPRLSREAIAEMKKTSRCGACKELGHWHRECPRLSQTTTANNKTQPKTIPNVSLNVNGSDTNLENKWVLDSGATSNMSNNQDWFSKLHLFETPWQVKVGDGNHVEVIGIGEIKFVSTVYDSKVTGTLTNVLLIPKLAANLISIGAAAKKGVTAIFDDKECKFVQGDQTILIGSRINGDLYIIDMTVILPETAMITKLERSDREWHEVLGHHPEARVKELLKHSKVGAKIEKFKNNCPDCPEGKGRHPSHPTNDAHRTTQVGGRVHVDVVHCGNKGESNYYYLLSKDEASEYSFVHFIDSKAETVDAIEKMLIDFEVGSGQPIRTIHSDNGSEFVNHKVKNLLLYERIKHETSAPYVPQQNGLVERAVQSINNSARVMLLASQLPAKLQHEAIRTSCYLMNRMPTKRSKITPYERFTGRAPFIGHLVRFGEPAHMIINGRHLRKFDARTVECNIVGYTRRRNTYRAWVPSQDKVVETCDVIFAPHKSGRKDHNVGMTSTEKVEIDHPTINCSEEYEDDEYYTSHPINKEPCIELDSEQVNEQEDDQPRSSTPQEGIRYGKNGLPYITTGDLDAYFNERQAEIRIEHEDDDPEDDENEADVSRGCTLSGVNTSSHQVLTTVENRCRLKSEGSFHLVALADVSPTEPKSYKDAIRGPNRSQWKAAIEAELQAHETNHTWIVCTRPEQGTTLTARWVFKLKRTGTGAIERFKARLVARGFEQRAGIDFKETFAPVASIESVKTLLSIAASERLKWVQFDITTAFLNGDIEEEVFMEPPEGVELESNQCLKLKKALYGLKQAPRAWSSKFNEALISIGFTPTVSDPCVFSNADKSVFIVTYVDDGMIFGKNQEECMEIIEQLNKHFTTNTVTGSIFLGIEIAETASGVQMHQKRYICESLVRFNLQDAKPVSTPIVSISELDGEEEIDVTVPYQEAIGTLLYIALNTRPDILFATITLSRYNKIPTKRRWHAVQRVFRYLSGTKDLGLSFVPPNDAATSQQLVHAYADADWGGSNSGFSTSGIVILLNNCPIICRSVRQRSIALSTCEAEYVATSDCAKEVMWLTGLLSELGVNFVTPTIFVDNQSAVATIKSSAAHKGLRHIRLRHQFLKNEFNRGSFAIQYIHTEDQLADIMTKIMTRERLKHLLPMVGMKLKISSSLALICFLLANTNQQASGVKHLTKLPAVTWVPSNYQSVTKTYRQTITFSELDRCWSLQQSFSGETTTDDGVMSMINKTIDECHRRRDKIYRPLMQELKRFSFKRPGRFPRDTNIGRPLRTAQSPAGFYSSMILPQAQLIYQYENKESAFNTAFDHEKLIDDAYGKLGDHEKRFQQIEQGSNSSISSVRTLINEVNQTTVRHEKIFANIPMVIRAMGSVILDIQRDADLLGDLIYNMKRGKVDYRALYKMYPDDSIEGAIAERVWTKLQPSIEDTFLDSFTHSNGFFRLSFSYDKIDKELVFYKAISFKIWESKDHYRSYTGGKLLLHNLSINCTKIIPEPPLSLGTLNIAENCTAPNSTFSASELELREVHIDDNTREQETKPVVVRVGDERLIQCYQHQITIDGLKSDCIREAFSIPTFITVEINNFTHTFEETDESLRQEVSSDNKVVGAEIRASFNQSMTEALLMIRKAEHHNNELKEMNIRGSFQELLFKDPVVAATAGGSVLMMFLVLGGIGCWLLCRKSPMVEIAEAALMSSLMANNQRPSGAASMPNLCVFHPDRACMTTSMAQIHSERIDEVFSIYPDLPPSYDKAEVVTVNLPDTNNAKQTRFLIDTDKEFASEVMRFCVKPPTPHPQRKVKEPKFRYAGKVASKPIEAESARCG